MRWFSFPLGRSGGAVINLITFAIAGRSIAALLLMKGRGKSGQHRASHFLTGRFPQKCGKQQVPQKITVPQKCGIMVKTRGKSPRPAVVILQEGKPWELKDQINRSLRAARSISEGRLLDPCGDTRTG